ncbi:MAG: phosphohydrolase, partial [Sulfuricella sp.]
AVADVFDALTSRRSYKDAWSNDAAFDLLLELSDSKFDRDCVQTLIARREEVEQIQARFREETIS